MSGAGRSIFNATDQIRLGADHILRTCRERYHDDPVLSDLLKWHHGFVVPRQLSWATAEREAHAGFNMMWNVWQGSASPKQIAEFKKKVGAFRERCKREGRLEFCETIYSKIIREAFEEALFATRNGTKVGIHIRGPAGCGKSLITEACCRDNNHGSSTFYEPKGLGGKRQLLEDLAFMKGIDRASNSIKLATRVFNSWEPGMLLAVDEIHLLVFEKTLKQPLIDVLRRMMDIRKIALFVNSTEHIFENSVAAGKWNDTQWWRRMMEIIDLPAVAPDKDVDSLFAFKFPGLNLLSETREYLLNINHHKKGGFGQVAIILDKILLKAKRKEIKVTAEIIEREVDSKWEALDRRR
jgi:hypothetical protein